MPSPVLKLENVSRLLGDHWRLRDLNLEVSAGEVVAEVLHRLEHELDIEALRTGIGELRVSAGNRRS